MHLLSSKNCSEEKHLYTDYKKIYCSGNKQISEDKDDIMMLKGEELDNKPNWQTRHTLFLSHKFRREDVFHTLQSQ